jgi:hypothetical protein
MNMPGVSTPVTYSMIHADLDSLSDGDDEDEDVPPRRTSI